MPYKLPLTVMRILSALLNKCVIHNATQADVIIITLLLLYVPGK